MRATISPTPAAFNRQVKDRVSPTCLHRRRLIPAARARNTLGVKKLWQTESGCAGKRMVRIERIL